MLELISKFTNPAGSNVMSQKTGIEKSTIDLPEPNGFAGKLAALLPGFSETAESNSEDAGENGFLQLQPGSDLQGDMQSDKNQVISEVSAESLVLPEGEVQSSLAENIQVQVPVQDFKGFKSSGENRILLQDGAAQESGDGIVVQKVTAGATSEEVNTGPVLNFKGDLNLKSVNHLSVQEKGIKPVANIEKTAVLTPNHEILQSRQGEIQAGLKQTVVNNYVKHSEGMVFISDNLNTEQAKQAKTTENNQAAVRIENKMAAEGFKSSGQSMNFVFQGEALQSSGNNMDSGIKKESTKSNSRQQAEFKASASGEKAENKQQAAHEGFKNTRIPVQESRPGVNRIGKSDLQHDGNLNFKIRDLPEPELIQNKESKSIEAVETNRARSQESQAMRNDAPLIFQASERRSFSVRLARVVKQELQHAKSDQNGWQKHQFMFDDGTKIQLALRKADGVVQLQLGSANSEMNRLIQQHANEIRQYLEEQMDLDVNLQFTESENNSGHFSSESNKRNSDSGLHPLNSGARGVEDTKSTLGTRGARYFGFNNNEWTA